MSKVSQHRRQWNGGVIGRWGGCLRTVLWLFLQTMFNAVSPLTAVWERARTWKPRRSTLGVVKGARGLKSLIFELLLLRMSTNFNAKDNPTPLTPNILTKINYLLEIEKNNFESNLPQIYYSIVLKTNNMMTV